MRLGFRIALVLIAILLACVVFAPVPGGSIRLGTLHNAAHAPIFGLIAALAMLTLRADERLGAMRASRHYLIAFGLASFLGLATEIAQTATGRDPSFADLGRDALGALTFLLLFAAVDRRLRTGRGSQVLRATALGLAMAALVAITAPVARALLEYRERDQRFPVLADYSHDLDLYFVERGRAVLEPITLPPQWAAAGRESALRVKFNGHPYSGFEIIEPVSDWRGYTTLALDLINPTDSTLPLVLRVHDSRHNQQYEDRFNQSLTVAANTRLVLRFAVAQIEAAPARRQLDLREIAGVMLFRKPSSRAGEMYVSRVWLER